MTTDTSLSAILPYGHFLGDDVYLRGRGLMTGYALRGLSVEGNSPIQAKAASYRLARAMSTWGTGDMLHIITYRLPAADYPQHTYPTAAATMIDEERKQRYYTRGYQQTRTRLYLTRQFESNLASGVRSAVLSTPLKGTSIALQRERFNQTRAQFQDALGDDLIPLTRKHVMRDLILSVTGRDYPALPPQGAVKLNEVVSSERFVGGQQPSIGNLHMRPVCITGYPAEIAEPQVLGTLLRHEGQMTIGARFICQDLHAGKEQLELERDHWQRMKFGRFKDWMAAAFRIDNSDRHQFEQAQIDELDGAIAEAQAGMAFGWATITAVILDPDPERAAARADDVLKDLLAQGLTARIEDANAPDAIMGTWPGDGIHNVRKPMIPAAVFADMVLPSAPWEGIPPSPLVCTGTGRAPFHWPTEIGGVANQLMIGPTGSGKSAALGAYVAALTGIPDARIIWLDLDYSSFVLAHALGADYHDADRISPMQFIAETEWLYDWFCRLYARWDVKLDEVQSADLTRSLTLCKEHLLVTMTELCALLQDQRLRAITANYTASGQWGHIFDGNADKDDSIVTVYEMRGLVALGERAAAPATELLLHNAERAMGGSPTFIIVDEAWRMLSDEISRDWLFAAIRTFRKRNSGIALATQSLVEITADPGLCGLLLESCPAKLFLPNPEAAGAYVREAYRKLGLHDHEIDLIATAQPKRQYYYHSPIGKRLFDLDLGPLAKALCASTHSTDVQRARDLLNTNDDFVTAWLQGRNYNGQVGTSP